MRAWNAVAVVGACACCGQRRRGRLAGVPQRSWFGLVLRCAGEEQVVGDKESITSLSLSSDSRYLLLNVSSPTRAEVCPSALPGACKQG